MMAATIASVQLRVLHVSPRTNWSFVALHTSGNQVFWGEASLNGWEPLLQGAVVMLNAQLKGLTREQAAVQLAVSPHSPGGLAFATAISAVAQAMLEWSATQSQQTWPEQLGPMRRKQLRAYANINRATRNRTPEGFVAVAKRAIEQGFTAFKAAPFDGLTPSLCNTSEGQQRLHHGITCMLGLREAIGPNARLMLDCHWRLDEARARELLKALAPAQLHWLECPLPELADNAAALKRLRHLANGLGVLTAGAETLIGVQGFQPLFDAGIYDVVMPDVKYCGGPWLMLQIACRAQDAGVAFSPHNPSGPLASLHSLNVASVAPECDMIELQFDESPFFEALVPGLHPVLQQGSFAVPLLNGVRVTLNEGLLGKHPFQPVAAGVESLAMGEPDKILLA